MNIRPRRNRKNSAIRDMVQETKLGVENLIYPIFLEDGKGIKTEIKSLPNNYRWSLDLLLPEVEKCIELGVKTFDIFPAVNDDLKDTVFYKILSNMILFQCFMFRTILVDKMKNNFRFNPHTFSFIET